MQKINKNIEPITRKWCYRRTSAWTDGQSNWIHEILPQSRGLNKWWEEHPHTFWEFIIKIATSIKYVKTPWEEGEGQGGKWISKINELQATHSFKTQK